MPKRILVIDDDPTLLKLVQGFLTSHDYEVIIVTNAEDALEDIRTERPDLIILDVQMPKMNGYTFIFELKKIVDIKALPVLILTSKLGMEEIFKVEGVKEYLIKPVQTAILLERIKKYIN